MKICLDHHIHPIYENNTHNFVETQLESIVESFVGQILFVGLATWFFPVNHCSIFSQMHQSYNVNV
ncbi:hypothetical protein DERP_000221 [Dermatophagoides pteronyssinus]|uniref:Uncharacterized protein n=1 Tax=Dermatophagoides pteronyssinus TaxID=6956 RepID=A0ABQ8IZI9_DERPT|nr:hypothetical protein DERP_000221 [Dermatophagoides pteronyssinus]